MEGAVHAESVDPLCAIPYGCEFGSDIISDGDDLFYEKGVEALCKIFFRFVVGKHGIHIDTNEFIRGPKKFLCIPATVFKFPSDVLFSPCFNESMIFLAFGSEIRK